MSVEYFVQPSLPKPATLPVRRTTDRIGLLFAFAKALMAKEKRLPEKIFQNSAKELFNRKEVFIQSAETYGTPQYFYDFPSLMEHVGRFHQAFSNHLPHFRAFYALKSNSFTGIIKDVVSAGMGLDASSGREVSMALETGCREILFSGPGKTDEELMLCLQNRRRIILLVDSFGELGRLSKLMREAHKERDPFKIGVRVQGIGEDRWEKFGIPLDDLGDMLQEATNIPGVLPCGIQFHTSWNFDPSRQKKMIKDLGFYLQRRVPRHLQASLTFLDIGGGFWPEQGEWLSPSHTPLGKLAQILRINVPSTGTYYYRPSKSIEHFAMEIAAVLSAQPAPINGLKVFMEPGRWISHASMHILLRVIDKKKGQTVITDGGIHLLGWERPLHEFMPIMNLTRPSYQERYQYICGSLCTPDDVWGHAYLGDGIAPGDILLVPNQGAYTYSLKQAFIKTLGKVVKYDGASLENAETIT